MLEKIKRFFGKSNKIGSGSTVNLRNMMNKPLSKDRGFIYVDAKSDRGVLKEKEIKYNNMLHNIAEHKKRFKGIKKYLTRMMIILIITIPSLIYLMWLNISSLNIDSSIYNILSVPLQGFILFLLILMINKEITSIFEKRKNAFEDIVNRYENIQ